MKRLVCEMCGSTDLLKQDGVFVCQSCGTKYSVEEAKKMMVEGTVEVTGTVSIDRSNEVENRLANAINEFRNGNNDVVFSICSDILNIDPNNYRAIIYKGLADGWRSSIDMPKLDVASAELQRAIGILRAITSNDDEYTEKSTEALIEMQKLGATYFDLCDKLNQEEQRKFDLLLNKASEATNNSKRVVKSDPYAAQRYVNEAKRYFNAANEIAGSKRKQYNARCANAVQPLNALGTCVLTGIRNKEDVGEHFCSVMKEYMDSYGSYFLHAMEIAPKLGDSRAYIAKTMKELEQIAKEKADQKRKERIEEYWKEHNEEKEALLSEKNTIEDKLTILSSELAQYKKELGDLDDLLKTAPPSAQAYENQRSLVKSLESQRSKLGLFQGKEKKALNERISVEQAKMEQLNKTQMAEKEEHKAKINGERAKVLDKISTHSQSLSKLENKKNEIVKELTMDR